MVDEYLMPSGDFQQQALNIHQPFFLLSLFREI